ncbi:MAG: membrane protein insertion efficiency factor YidD [Candidatus Omnitrophota bacterium]|nr:membrane protein insertion efficiency factor YidD [Candidatus Omnitrophota bacterium]
MLRKLALYAVGAYRFFIRGVLPPSCRFSPSCSEYAQQALLKYGFWQGNLKAVKRICSCHPWSAKSVDDPLI